MTSQSALPSGLTRRVYPEAEPAARDRCRRGQDGRFAVAGDLHGRYAAVVDVLRAVSPGRPECVSTRKFDAARERAGHSGLPRAQDLANWLGMSWDEVKAVALDEKRDRVRIHKSRHRAAPWPWRDTDGAVLALKRVAEALEQDHLAATTYDAYRKNARSATRELLPTSAQIVKLCDSWAAALALADLPPAAGAPARVGLPVVKAIGVFVRTQGRLPGRAELEAFATDARWPFPMQRIGGRPWQTWLDDFERWWVDELKRWMPPPTAGRLPFVPLNEEDVATLPKPERAPKGWWNRERVAECVVDYLEAHPDLPSLQQPPYRTWAKRRTAHGIRTAAPSTLTKYGTLEKLERDARRTISDRAKPDRAD